MLANVIFVIEDDESDNEKRLVVLSKTQYVRCKFTNEKMKAAFGGLAVYTLRRYLWFTQACFLV